MDEADAVTWDPEDYARNSSAQLGWARDLIVRLRLRGDEAVLDVGCGDGKITAEFAAALPGGYVLGVDSSPEFVTYARRHYPPSRFPNVEFALMDARRLSSERAFDLVFSNAALHWVDDHPAFLAGCARLLRTGGRLVMSCGGAGNADEVVKLLGELIVQPHWRPFFRDFRFPYYFHSADDYRRWLPESGLVATRVELIERDMVHAGAAGLAGWVRTTWMPYTQRVPEVGRPAFVESIVAGYLRDHPADDQGHIHVPMVRLEVEAVERGMAPR
jgi:trans-aconitate 2-methyltransferase